MRLKLLMGTPSRAEVDAARQILADAGFAPPTCGTWRKHKPGSRLEGDVIVVGAGERTRDDVHGRWLQVDTVDDLRRVGRDAEGRPYLAEVEPEPEPEATTEPEPQAPEVAAVYRIEERTRGWYDVVDRGGRPQNDKALREDEAQGMLATLTGGGPRTALARTDHLG